MDTFVIEKFWVDNWYYGFRMNVCCKGGEAMRKAKNVCDNIILGSHNQILDTCITIKLMCVRIKPSFISRFRYDI